MYRDALASAHGRLEILSRGACEGCAAREIRRRVRLDRALLVSLFILPIVALAAAGVALSVIPVLVFGGCFINIDCVEPSDVPAAVSFVGASLTVLIVAFTWPGLRAWREELRMRPTVVGNGLATETSAYS